MKGLIQQPNKYLQAQKRSCSKFRTMIIISSPTPQVGEIETIHSL
jgi:hypothetical protein